VAKSRKKKRPVRTFFSRLTTWFGSGHEEAWKSAGGVVVNRGGAVALIRQKKRWTFPKGRLDPGEGLSQAARREVYEETGLRTRIRGYLGVLEGARHDTYYFLMALVEDESVHGVHDEEVDEVRFVKPSKAKDLLRPRDRRVLKRALDTLAGYEPASPRIG
jgi:8-oxo-dGTP pyrophosphatase MutT (NUDIX family)